MRRRECNGSCLLKEGEGLSATNRGGIGGGTKSQPLSMKKEEDSKYLNRENFTSYLGGIKKTGLRLSGGESNKARATNEDFSLETITGERIAPSNKMVG